MVRDRLDLMDKRYEEVNNLLTDSEVVSDVKRLMELSKEQRQLEKVVTPYREYKSLEESISSLKEMAHESDPEMAQMAQAELDSAHKRMAELEEELKVLLLPKDPNDDKDVIMEIRGAVGGDEANILPVIYLECTQNMLNQKVGKLLFMIQCHQIWADIHKFLLKFLGMLYIQP